MGQGGQESINDKKRVIERKKVFKIMERKIFRKVSTFAKSRRMCPKRHKKAAFLILSYLKGGFDTLFDCGENADKFLKTCSKCLLKRFQTIQN